MSDDFNDTPGLNDRQRFAVHFFDERGDSILSQIFLQTQNSALEQENMRLRHLLAKLQLERKQRPADKNELF